MKTSVKQSLLKKLEDHSAVVGVIGLGYVGLPITLRLLEVGYRVIGFDTDTSKIERLTAGESYIRHIPAEKIAWALSKGFQATDDYRMAKQADALIICVPTPLTKYREPDLQFVIGTVDALVPNLRSGQLISLESTTYPGTTEEEIQPRVESTGLKVGQDIFLVYSPEREDPGNPNFTTRSIPKLCGGSTDACLEVGMALYGQAVDQVIPVSSPRTAEMAKLLENIHRAVNIGLVNEMKIIADKIDIDIHEVIRCAATKPFGFVPYYPGPGLGGHCIPIDPFYLTWKVRAYGVHTRFIELAGEVNSGMPAWVVGKIGDALNGLGKAIKGSRILILGLAYKKNVDDMRESPAVEVMELLAAKGAQLEYSDPYISTFPRMREHHFDLNSVPLTAANIAGYDCVVLTTDHDDFDYPFILKHARQIVDTRGVYLESNEKITKA